MEKGSLPASSTDTLLVTCFDKEVAQQLKRPEKVRIPSRGRGKDSNLDKHCLFHRRKPQEKWVAMSVKAREIKMM